MLHSSRYSWPTVYPMGRPGDISYPLLTSAEGWVHGGGAQLEIRPEKPRGSAVQFLHPDVRTGLRSSAHILACDATVCKHNVPLYDSHCDVFLFLSIQWFVRKFLKELQCLTRCVSLALADCQTSVVSKSECPWIHPTKFKSITDVTKLKACFVVDLLYYLNENRNLVCVSLIFDGLTSPVSVRNLC